MLNKSKLPIFVASIIASILPNSTFAKTEKSYLNLGFIHSRANHKNIVNYQINNNNLSMRQENSPKTFEDNGNGIALAYSYAFNYNNVFIAPGVFAELINTKSGKGRQPAVSLVNSYNYFNQFNVNSRQGLKLDIGYDLHNNFAIYGSTGLARTSFSNYYQTNLVLGTRITNGKISSSENAIFYGGGLLFNVNDKVSVNTELTTQSFKSNDIFDHKIKTRLNVFKAGVSYRF